MIKSFFVSFALTLVKRFLMFLFGGLPPVNDKESFRLWCLKNHRYLSLIVTKTANQWDDQFSAMLLHVLETPELYELIWNSITGNLTEAVHPPLYKPQRFVKRVLGLLVQGTKIATND